MKLTTSQNKIQLSLRLDMQRSRKCKPNLGEKLVNRVTQNDEIWRQRC